MILESNEIKLIKQTIIPPLKIINNELTLS